MKKKVIVLKQAVDLKKLAASMACCSAGPSPTRTDEE